jgi:protein-tyrosine phosphatase
MSSILDVHAHGGKRALLRFVFYGATALLGAARRYRNIDWPRVRRIVFVCKGNISRSPFAEAVARRRGLNAVSAGLEASRGDPAAPQAIVTAADFAIDLTAHRSSPAEDIEFAPGDLVVGFEPLHLERLDATIGNQRLDQTSLLGAWLRPPNLYIHDPYGASAEYFRLCFSRIECAVGRLSREMIDKGANGSK